MKLKNSFNKKINFAGKEVKYAILSSHALKYGIHIPRDHIRTDPCVNPLIMRDLILDIQA